MTNDVTIAITTRDRPALTLSAVENARLAAPEARIVVVDSGSSLENVRRLRQVSGSSTPRGPLSERRGCPERCPRARRIGVHRVPRLGRLDATGEDHLPATAARQQSGCSARGGADIRHRRSWRSQTGPHEPTGRALQGIRTTRSLLCGPVRSFYRFHLCHLDAARGSRAGRGVRRDVAGYGGRRPLPASLFGRNDRDCPVRRGRLPRLGRERGSAEKRRVSSPWSPRIRGPPGPAFDRAQDGGVCAEPSGSSFAADPPAQVGREAVAGTRGESGTRAGSGLRHLLAILAASYVPRRIVERRRDSTS